MIVFHPNSACRRASHLRQLFFAGCDTVGVWAAQRLRAGSLHGLLPLGSELELRGRDRRVGEVGALLGAQHPGYRLQVAAPGPGPTRRAACSWGRFESDVFLEQVLVPLMVSPDDDEGVVGINVANSSGQYLNDGGMGGCWCASSGGGGKSAGCVGSCSGPWGRQGPPQAVWRNHTTLHYTAAAFSQQPVPLSRTSPLRPARPLMQNPTDIHSPATQ